MARVAATSFCLGLHGEIQAGDEIPETYETPGVVGEQPTDFDRLAELGLIADEGDAQADDADAPKPKRSRAKKS